MKIRFDTNTKDADAAASAWLRLDAEASPKDLTLTINSWGDLHYNISGEIDSKYVKLMEDLFNTSDFNEDSDKL